MRAMAAAPNGLPEVETKPNAASDFGDGHDGSTVARFFMVGPVLFFQDGTGRGVKNNRELSPGGAPHDGVRRRSTCYGGASRSASSPVAFFRATSRCDGAVPAGLRNGLEGIVSKRFETQPVCFTPRLAIDPGVRLRLGR
jgi:hypothetical protein